jgi:proline dehydrogenase
MLVSRFIGGHDIASVQRTANLLYMKNITPIFDFAKEASSTRTDVYRYVNEMHALVHNLGVTNKDFAVALKLSSFLPHYPYDNMKQIIDHIIDTKSEGKKYVFLDAETTALKPIEKYVYDRILKTYNDTHMSNTVIYKTYQMYRKDALKELADDVKVFKGRYGAKLVRGAYHSPRDASLFQCKLETDNNYDAGAAFMIRELLHNKDLQVCLATHNDLSVHRAMMLMNDAPNFINDQVSYAQLYGMGDTLTNNILQGGCHKVFKYLPYGPFKDVVPYLVRRLYENMGMLKHTNIV